MSERSTETFISNLIEPSELDADEEQLEHNYEKACYESSKIEIIDSVGANNFQDVWLTLKDDIQFETIKLQRIFSEQILDKIFEVYDFSFPDIISLETQYELDDFYQFLQFFEYENTKFLIYVWSFLGQKNLMKLDIESFCKNNTNVIIKEIGEQLELHPQPKLTNIFLRSCYKEKIIEWFIKNSTQKNIDITVNLSI
jgi:hypothetical protein